MPTPSAQLASMQKELLERMQAPIYKHMPGQEITYLHSLAIRLEALARRIGGDNG